jgi:carbon monoxide dehydrogenase subunit G
MRAPSRGAPDEEAARGMQQSGQHRIAAPIDTVWRGLNDPELLARCIEGCQSMERVGDNAFRAQVKARIGPVSALFTAEIVQSDLDPPRSCTLAGSVKGGPAGFGKGTAHVRLAPDGRGTLLHYDVDGSVGGKLAQVGQRLVDGAARKLADDFFAAFSDAVATEVAPPRETEAAEPRSRGSVRLWALGGIVALAAAYLAVLWLRH